MAMTASKRTSSWPLTVHVLAAAGHVAHCGRGSPFCNRHGNTMEATNTAPKEMIRIRIFLTPFRVKASAGEFTPSTWAGWLFEPARAFVPRPAPPHWRTTSQLLSARLAISGTEGRTSVPPMAMTASKRTSSWPLTVHVLAAAGHVAHSGRGSPFCNRHGNTMEAEHPLCYMSGSPSILMLSDDFVDISQRRCLSLDLNSILDTNACFAHYCVQQYNNNYVK
jgi:hypothetical protein